MEKYTCPLAFGLARHLRRKPSAKSLILTDGSAQSHELLRQLKFFLHADFDAEWFEEKILILPDNELLPYDSFSPDPHTTSRRIRAFHRLLSGDYLVVIVNIKALLGLLAPTRYFAGRGFYIKQGQRLDYRGFITDLSDSGYRRVNYVTQPGEMAVRGSIVDVFPMALEVPYRLEWLDDEVESLRSFSTADQLTIAKAAELGILPRAEFPTEQQALERFITAWESSFTGSARRHPIYLGIKQGEIPAGIEAFLPLFFREPLASCFDYLEHSGHGYKVFYSDTVLPLARKFLEDARRRWRDLGGEDAVLLPPDKLFMDYEQLESKLHCKENLFRPQSWRAVPKVAAEAQSSGKLARLLSFYHSYKGRVLVSLSSDKRYQLICDWLHQSGAEFSRCSSWQDFITKQDARLSVLHSDLTAGAVGEDWAIICEEDLFGNFISTKEERRQLPVSDGERQDTAAQDLRDLGAAQFTPGELVIHSDYGLGRFLGLEKVQHEDYSGEYLVIEYAEETKLYLPVYDLHLLSSYSSIVASGQEYPLDKLGGKGWSKRKAQALARIEDTAMSLLETYAQRRQIQGLAFLPPDKDYEEFVLGFPFQETQGQAQAISEVLRDMTSAKKTDRLICGDVGFGKTEIALRAAYLAVASGYQVAVLTPTTLLASQHLLSFRARFAKTPFELEELSRLTTKPAAVLKGLADGKIDIVIGTHALLGSKVGFRNLGLVIVDEEHRFGVRQKEKLKSLHKNVEIISLSATPIPRTLNMALSGLRDISLLATPPPGRLPIKTYSGLYSDDVVKEAVQRELMRDGQVYFIYNDIDNIYHRRDELRRIFPDAAIAAVHGRLDKREMEHIMYNFYNGKISILVCTTIIENGLDAPNANTLIVSEADRFGLSQLHQLRGRVGRRKRQAFAYLMQSPDANPKAVKRIKTLLDNSALGAGFNLANYDLEFRGAGQILGAEQSGFMQSIGLELYTQMLEQALHAQRQEAEQDMRAGQAQTQAARQEQAAAAGQDEEAGQAAARPRQLPPLATKIDIALSAFFPDDYIEDVVERMKLYKRLSRCDAAALEQQQRALVDIYGPLPLYAANLFELHKLRIRAAWLGISEIKITRSNGYLSLAESQQSPHQATLAACQKLADSEPHNYMFKHRNLHFNSNEHHLLAATAILNKLHQLV